MVVEARPELYGLTLFALAGQGTLCDATLSAGSSNASAYAVKNAAGDLSLVVVNKDTTQNLELSISLQQSVRSASLIAMSQLSSGATGPNLTATSGVTIQGNAIAANGDFSPGEPYSLSTSGSQINCFVPALSAVLIQTKQ